MVKYTFRTLVPEDKALFCGWVNQPHIAGWWQPAEREWSGISDEWARGDMRITKQVAQADGVDIGFIQSYNIREYALAHYADCDANAQAIDCFLGHLKYLAKGHGTGFIQARATQLLTQGASAVLVDPEALNTHAIGCYERVGFQRVKQCEADHGVTLQIMEFTGDTPI